MHTHHAYTRRRTTRGCETAKSRAVSHGRAVSRSARRPYLRHARVGAAERQLTRVRLDWAVAGARPGGGERVGAERRVADREQYVRGGDDGRRSAVGGRRPPDAVAVVAAAAPAAAEDGLGRRRARRRRRPRRPPLPPPPSPSPSPARRRRLDVARRRRRHVVREVRPREQQRLAAHHQLRQDRHAARAVAVDRAQHRVRRTGDAARTRPPTRAGSSRREPTGGALRDGIDGHIHVDRSHVVAVRAAVVRGAHPMMPSQNMGGVAVDDGSRQHRTRARIIVRAPRTAARRLRAVRAPATPIPRPLLVSWVGLKARWGAPKARLKARPKAPTGILAVPAHRRLRGNFGGAITDAVASHHLPRAPRALRHRPA